MDLRPILSYLSVDFNIVKNDPIVPIFNNKLIFIMDCSNEGKETGRRPREELLQDALKLTHCLRTIKKIGGRVSIGDISPFIDMSPFLSILKKESKHYSLSREILKDTMSQIKEKISVWDLIQKINEIYLKSGIEYLSWYSNESLLVIIDLGANISTKRALRTFINSIIECSEDNISSFLKDEAQAILDEKDYINDSLSYVPPKYDEKDEGSVREFLSIKTNCFREINMLEDKLSSLAGVRVPGNVWGFILNFAIEFPERGDPLLKLFFEDIVDRWHKVQKESAMNTFAGWISQSTVDGILML